MILKAIALSVFFIVLILIQFPSLKKSKKISDIFTYSLFMLIAMVYTYGFVFDIKLPNVIKLMMWTFKPLHEFMLSIIL